MTFLFCGYVDFDYPEVAETDLFKTGSLRKILDFVHNHNGNFEPEYHL